MKASLGNDAVVERLQNLIRARVELLQSKIDVQHDYIHRIIGEDAAAVDELQTFTDSHKLLEGIAGFTDNLQGDGKIIMEQVEKARKNEINAFHRLVDEHCNAFERRAQIYAEFADEGLRENVDY